MKTTLRLSESVGTMVISREEGAHLGFVERIGVDPRTCSMSALTFRQSRLSPEQAALTGSLVTLGRDVTFIETETAAVPATEAVKDEYRWLNELIGLPVTTQAGDRVGTLVDVGVSPEDWRIVEIYLSGERTIAIKAGDTTNGAGRHAHGQGLACCEGDEPEGVDSRATPRQLLGQRDSARC